MYYAVRKPMTVLGETYKPGDRLDGSKVPGTLVTKLAEQHRITLVDESEHGADPVPNDAAVAPKTKKRGRPPKAAVAAAGGA